MKAFLKKLIPAPVQPAIKSILSHVGERAAYSPPGTRIFSKPGTHVFFGYYDVSPFSADHTMLLAMQTPCGVASPHVTHPPLTLGTYDLNSGDSDFRPFAQTMSWNWQQGCRLQWVPGLKDCVVYNDTGDDRYQAVIRNVISGDIIQKISHPVYTMSHDGKNILTLDFFALHQHRPGYGYNNFRAQSAPDIQCVDVGSGEAHCVLTLNQAKAFDPHTNMSAATHYFNHLSFSPKSRRFMVTHLWVTGNGDRYTRILIVSMDDGSILCPNNSGHTSHYAWRSDDEVLIFDQGVNGLMHYTLHDLNTGSNRIIGAGQLNEDGHPGFVTKDRILTDTYPDLLRLQTIMTHDLETQATQILAKFHVPSHYTGEMRCDLHPRIRDDGKVVCADIVDQDYRAMCIMPIQE